METKNTDKRMTVLLLAAILCLCLASCGKVPKPEQSLQEPHTEATDTEGFEEMQKPRDSSAPSGNVADSSREPVQQSIELIGPEGWHGTYTVEDEEIHAQLISDLEQSTQLWDFRITSENDAAILEMDYQDMTIYWAYGDREDIPAMGVTSKVYVD